MESVADSGPLSHIDDQGAAHMVDVTGKAATKRTAVAAGSLRTSAHVVELIKQVLFTSPGERVNRPDFGCGVKRMVFAPNSEVVASLAQVTIIDSLQRWLDPVITVNTVTVKAIDEVLQILVVYTLKARQQRLYLNLEVTL